MHKQPHDTLPNENVKLLWNDVQYIDLQIKDLKTDLQYIMRLIESFERELSYVKRGVLCPQ